MANTDHMEMTSSEQQALAWGLSFANGYFELGMLDRAEKELNKLAQKFQDKPEVLAMREPQELPTDVDVVANLLRNQVTGGPAASFAAVTGGARRALRVEPAARG